MRRRIESGFPPGQSSEQTRAQLLAAQLQPENLIDTFRRIRRGEFDTGSVREQRAEEALPPGPGNRPLDAGGGTTMVAGFEPTNLPAARGTLLEP